MHLENTLKLSDLNALVQKTIQRNFENQYYWIIADVSNHTYKSEKGFHHFELVEKSEDAQVLLARIPAKAWGQGALHIKNFEKITGQQFTNHIHVLLKVEVTFHQVFGLSLQVLDIDTRFTLGLIEEKRQKTLSDLVAKNSFIQKIGDEYFTKNKSLRLPKVIQKIAILSSVTSAGIEDFKHTLQNNPYAYSFEIQTYHSLVQGAQNARDLREKLIEIYKEHEKGNLYDAVVIIRGGGSQTDFLIFDDYFLAQAVAKFPIPIITGIGHQKNETLVDLMAHTFTKTPTQAAEFILLNNRNFEDKILSLQKDIIIQTQNLFKNFQLDLQSIHSTLSYYPRLLLQKKELDLEKYRENLPSFALNIIKTEKGYLDHFKKLIHVLSPENTLKRGYALVKKEGKILKNTENVLIGEKLEIQLYKSTLQVQVEKNEK